MSENLPATKPAPAQVLLDPKTGAFLPKDLDGLYRLSTVLASSGLMPSGISSPADVFVCIQMGLEVGLSPMQSVQNISPINGRPAIWGDSQLALVRASGLLEEFSETMEGEFPHDTYKAVCKAKRHGDKTLYRHEFSMGDAKTAGLLPGKELSAWKKYPKRMLQMRARSWVLRDAFGDVLKGISQAEEAMDFDLDLNQQKDGSFAAPPMAQADDGFPSSPPEPREPLPPPGETVETLPSFDNMVQDKVSSMDLATKQPLLDELEDYILFVVGQCEVSKPDLELQAAKKFEAFWSSFEVWRTKQKVKSSEAPAKEAMQPGPSMDPAAQEEAKEEPQEIWDRAQWINLRASGLSTYVFKNRKQLQLAPADILEELKAKWEKIYEGGSPFPLLMEPGSPPPQEPMEPEASGQELNDKALAAIMDMQKEPKLLKLAMAQAKVTVIQTIEDFSKVAFEFDQLMGLI